MLLHQYKFLLLPTLPLTAPRHDDPDAIASARLRFSAFNAPLNMTGHPSVSVPCGFDGDGLPIGMQIVARLEEGFMPLYAAMHFQRATDWHKRPPPL
jgi:aspartyl-tRNA(Asn)/glutamyl-tRNA(Gln) amidotransferase subunit A